MPVIPLWGVWCLVRSGVTGGGGVSGFWSGGGLLGGISMPGQVRGLLGGGLWYLVRLGLLGCLWFLVRSGDYWGESLCLVTSGDCWGCL